MIRQPDHVVNDRLPEGQVLVGRLDSEWYMIQIGRARKVKRFNIRDSEARQLIEQLKELLP